MIFTIKNNQKQNLVTLTRKIGYRFLNEDKEKKINLIRPLERNGYPRFHIYLKFNSQKLIFNLHLDQKRPSYKGFPAHAGEYKGGVIEKEAERIKQILQ